MKRTLTLMLLLCCVTCAAAGAQSLSDAIIWTDAPPFLSIQNALSLEDGGLVLAGASPYGRNHVLCLNADGTVRWDGVDLGDIDTGHNVEVKGVLPDGRVMVGIISYEAEGQPDPAFFAIDTDGTYEPMDNVDFVETFRPDTLQVLPDGYLGGAYRQYSPFANDIGFPMEKVLLDFDLRERWKVDVSGYGDIIYFQGIQLDDGYILYGGGNTADQKESKACIMRLDRQGEPLWTFEGTYIGPGGAVTALSATDDGGVIFTGYYTPEGQQFTEEGNIILPVSAITRLDADGNVLWSRVYEAYNGVSTPVPMGDGYVAPAMDARGKHELLRLDGDGNVTGTMPFGTVSDDLVLYTPSLITGANGDVLAYGQTAEVMHLDSRVYILPITDGLFTDI